MKKVLKRSLGILIGITVACASYSMAVHTVQAEDMDQNVSNVPNETREDEKDTAIGAAPLPGGGESPKADSEEGGLRAGTPIAKLLLDINIPFKEKLNTLSKEEDVFESLKEMESGEVIKAFLYSLDVSECYQYTIFIQHKLLNMVQKDFMKGGEEKAKTGQKEMIDFALGQLKANHDALNMKYKIFSLEEGAKRVLETDLFEMVYADVCKDIKYHSGSKEKEVTALESLREYFTTSADVKIDALYEEMGCYRGVGEDTDKEKLLKNHMDSIYGFDDGPVSDKKTEDEKEQKTEAEKPKEPSASAESGDGVLKQVTSRTLDASTAEPNNKYRAGMSMPREENYYEVYANTEGEMAKSMEIVVSIGKEQKTYKAAKGEFKVEGAQYNWQMQVPYGELFLEGSDGKITADIMALDARSKVVGRAQALAATATGVYDNKKRWIGSDFAKLNTNKNADQVYYVYGTVYSDDCNAQNITNSTIGTGRYSHLFVSSLDSSRATVRVRFSGKAITGTWLMIYGRTELNNLNIIGCGGKDRTVGLVSAKNSKQTSSATKQSYLSANNCSFSVANKWALHGDRNSYLDVSNCTISHTKGGVGSHGEINVRNTSLDNLGSFYGGWAGIHLNVPVSQGGFKHSVNLQNNQAKGYLIGIEFAVSDFFSDQPVGDRLTSMSLTITGGGNTLTNCTTGILTSKQNVNIPLTLEVRNAVADIFNCITGILVGYENDTVEISGGSIRAGTIGVKNTGTFRMDGGNIYSNSTGIVNTGAARMTNGTIYGNCNNGSGGGVWTNKTFHISGGRIYNNTAVHGGGIFSEAGANTTISGGSVTQNTGQYGGGIFNQSKSSLTITGGAVSGNTGRAAGGGIYNENAAVAQITGGDISENAGALGIGIYQNGTLNLAGNAYVNSNNDIYLPAHKLVTVTGALSASQIAAVLSPSDCTLGRVCARTSYSGAKGSSIYQKFILNAGAPYMFRPGDYQSGSGKAKTDVVISQEYTISYHKNYDADISDVPPGQTKYWYEGARVARQAPSLAAITFLGWSEDSGAQGASYSPGSSIAADVNRDLTLYAIWEAKIKVTYVGNHAEAGDKKSEDVTKQECDKSGGYQVKKNSEYTKYTRPGYAFAGWAVSEAVSEVKDANYPEKKENRLTFEELRKIAVLQNHTGSKVPEAFMYDVWDGVPKINASGVQTFYEGTEVTKEMLLADVKAFDKEDGDLTGKIRIIKVGYAKGKLIDGGKADKTTEAWENDMPKDYKLDTWFQAMDKEDSPVIHEITYAVSDAFGSTTSYEWTVKVKYNEFPVVETKDRYFTLEEAQKGIISEEILINEALENGKLKVTDQEDDELYPGTIFRRVVLQDFKPDEFQQFQESGYVVLTYSVKDSMGPEGEGKETIRQFTVHVVKDGEIVVPESVKCVRFINEKYYELNAGISGDALTEEEKKALNTNGGLNVDSKWYQDETYKNLIHSLWAASKPEETWKFSHKDVEKVKAYVNEHGIGNSTQPDGLAGFANEFGGRCKVFD